MIVTYKHISYWTNFKTYFTIRKPRYPGLALHKLLFEMEVIILGNKTN